VTGPWPPRWGEKMYHKRYWAAVYVTRVWRLRQRLPHVTAFAKSLGLI